MTFRVIENLYIGFELHYHSLIPAEIWVRVDYAFVHYYLIDYVEYEGVKS